jgi:hypothetical protein
VDTTYNTRSARKCTKVVYLKDQFCRLHEDPSVLYMTDTSFFYVSTIAYIYPCTVWLHFLFFIYILILTFYWKPEYVEEDD